VFGVAAIFNDMLCHTFAISGVLYSEGVVIGTMELRTEKRHTRDSYPNDDLAAFTLSSDKYESRVCSLVCSELRKFRYVEGIVREIFIRACQATHSGAMAQILRLGLHYDFQPPQNYDRLQSRHHSNEFVQKLILLEAGK
jgi:hypothetical protein